MTRDYRQMLRGDGVFVPRWLVTLLLVGAVLLIALRIFVPPSWPLQRLDSPDGARSALLLRTRYLRENFVVRVKDGSLWRTVFYSEPLSDDFRRDLGERLSWSPDSTRLYFRMGGRTVWGYDFPQARDLTDQERE